MVEAGKNDEAAAEEIPPGFNMEEEAAFNEFVDDIAFDTLAESLGEAFSADLKSNAGSTTMLENIMSDVLGDPQAKADFTVDLMQNDEMLKLGLLGDEFETLATSPEYSQLTKQYTVQLISQGKFAGKLHSADPSLIETELVSKFPETE